MFVLKLSGIQRRLSLQGSTQRKVVKNQNNIVTSLRNGKK